MKQTYVPVTLDQYLNESKTITLRRGYGEKKPVVVGSSAPIRNQILAYVAENQRVSKGDLKRFIAGLNEGSRNPNASAIMWLKRNEQFFIAESKEGQTFFKLSPIGKRLSDRFITVPLTEKKKEDKKNKDDYDFVDTKKGYPRKGIYDVSEEEEEKECKKCGKKTCECSESVTESRKAKIEAIIERIKAKRAEAVNEEVKPVNEAEEEKEDEADELSFDDLDLGDEEEKEVEGEEEKEGGEEKSEEDEKVEITEFIITVTNAEEAIKELDELGVPAEKVEEEEEVKEEEPKETELEEKPEGEEKPDEETEGLDLGEAAEGDEEPATEEKIKVSVDYWDKLKGWLEDKGVDIEEMFGGEIEVEDEESEGGEEEPEGEEETDDFSLDLGDGEESAGEGEDDFSLDLEEYSEAPTEEEQPGQSLTDKIADKVAQAIVNKM